MAALTWGYRQLNLRLGNYSNHMNKKGCILLVVILILLSILPSLIEGKPLLDFPKSLISFIFNLDINSVLIGITIAFYIMILSLPFLLVPWLFFFVTGKLILEKMGRKILTSVFVFCLFFYGAFCFILFFNCGQLYTTLHNAIQNLPYLGFKLTGSLLRLAVLFLGIGIIIPMYNFLKNKEQSPES